MKLKEYRGKKGLTQEAVASRLGIPKKTYQNYEREVREPSTDILCALADLYDTSLDELTGRAGLISGIQSAEGQIVVFEDELAELNGCYFNMSDEAREALMEMAHRLEELSPRR